ncbi:MAG: TIGR03960 family B12-binding radical SAM protein [Candidatus Acidulodesulfobacterium sp.]
MKANLELYNKLNEYILPFVQKPVRYLGLETGTTIKDIKSIPLKFALAFPDFYELGMSHIGMGIIYDILNSVDYIACERVYLPYPDMNEKLKEHNIPLFSLESFEEIKNFDIAGFSLQYELSYTNVLLMLELSGIPVFSKDRTGADFPFIGAGGPCAFNPLPLNDFMDFFIIGDGEITTVEVCDTVLKAKNALKSGAVDISDYRNYVKRKLAEIRGVYVPGISKTVKKSLLNDIDLNHNINNNINDFSGFNFKNSGHTYINKHIVPLIETVHNRLAVEIARGCSSGCRFCQAGYIYRPVRERKKDTVLNAVKHGLHATGLEEISLSSLSTGDYSEIEQLLSELAELTEEEKISMSFPSMRIGSLSEDILKKTAAVKKTNFTLAPEAGTQRLRSIINKNISENDLLNEAAGLSQKGYKSLKLYFMIGLPFERIADLDGIAALIIKIKKVAKGLNVTVNVNNFVPKPHTPFQWFPMEKEENLNFKINYLKKILKPLNVNFKYQDPKVSFIEALISRGDEFTSKIIYGAYKSGAVYDSESRLFNYNAWIKALENENRNQNENLDSDGDGGKIDYHYQGYFNYLYEEKNINDPLPWDFIDIMIDKKFLKDEYKKSYLQNANSVYYFNSDIDIDIEGLSTQNCRKICYLCGVCDFKAVSPVYSSKAANIKMHKKNIKNNENEADENSRVNYAFGRNINKGGFLNESGGNFAKPDNFNGNNNIITAKTIPFSEITFTYSKREIAKYLGHLETVKILLKTFRILKIPLLYKESQYTLRPKLSYSNPIPFMSESDGLYIKGRIAKIHAATMNSANLADLKDKINMLLPEGLKIIDIDIKI